MSNNAFLCSLVTLLIFTIVPLKTVRAQDQLQSCRNPDKSFNYNRLKQCVSTHNITLVDEISGDDFKVISELQKKDLLDVICLNLLRFHHEDNYSELKNDLTIKEALIKNKLIEFNLRQEEVYLFFKGDVFYILSIITLYFIFKTGNFSYGLLLPLPLIAFKLSYLAFSSMTLALIKFLPLMVFLLFYLKGSFSINFKHRKSFQGYSILKTLLFIVPILALILILIGLPGGNPQHFLQFDFIMLSFLPELLTLSCFISIFVHIQFGIYQDSSVLRIFPFCQKSFHINRIELAEISQKGINLQLKLKNGTNYIIKFFFAKV